MMSFMGSIGSMMKGSGLEEALERAYGPNAVTHKKSGKAVSRALRGHFLVEAALVNKLVMAVLSCQKNGTKTVNPNEILFESENENDPSDIMEISFEDNVQMEYSTKSDKESETDVNVDEVDRLDATDAEKIHDLYEGIVGKSIPVYDVANSKELIKLEKCLLKYKALLVKKSRTAKLWLQ